MNVDCKEHSKTMELLSLRMKLEKGISDPNELNEVKKRIRLLEKELKLD
jgi:ribosomal protein L29